MAKEIIEIEKLLFSQKTTYGLFTAVLDNVPSSVRLSNFSLKKNVVILTGATYNAVDIKKYEKRLKKLLGEDTVVIKKITIDAGKYTFDVQIQT